MKLTKSEKIQLGERIKQIRLKKGMTTKEFGSLLGATDSNITSWEKGRTSPNPERLKTIAKLADMTVEELLYGNKLEYAMALCNSLIEESLQKSYSNKILITKYSNQFVDYIRNAITNYDLPSYTYDQVYSFVLSKFNEFQTTPTNAKKLISSLIRYNFDEINKIYKYISSLPSDNEHELEITSIDEIDKKIARKTINILDNTISELRELLKEVK